MHTSDRIKYFRRRSLYVLPDVWVSQHSLVCHVQLRKYLPVLLFIDFSGNSGLVMGGAQSTEVPGGGTEGYHVLRVRQWHKHTMLALASWYSFGKKIDICSLFTCSRHKYSFQNLQCQLISLAVNSYCYQYSIKCWNDFKNMDFDTIMCMISWQIYLSEVSAMSNLVYFCTYKCVSLFM